MHLLETQAFKEVCLSTYKKYFNICNFHTIFIITTGQLYLIMVTFHLFFFSFQTNCNTIPAIASAVQAEFIFTKALVEPNEHFK